MRRRFAYHEGRHRGNRGRVVRLSTKRPQLRSHVDVAAAVQEPLRAEAVVAGEAGRGLARLHVSGEVPEERSVPA